MTAMVEERLFTVREVADRLSVSPLTVTNWLRTGRLAGHQFGGRTGWRIPESEFARFLESTKRTGPSTDTDEEQPS